jgi:hypothetical protein
MQTAGLGWLFAKVQKTLAPTQPSFTYDSNGSDVVVTFVHGLMELPRFRGHIAPFL